MKIKAIYIYLALALWATLLGLSFRLTNFNTTGIAMILVFLTIILAIGGLLLRISHMRIQDFWAKVLYAIGFGLGFFLFINLLAMICGLTLGQLVFANSFFILVLFILSLWEDRREMYEINFTFIKNKTIGEWALIIVSISFGILAVLGVNSQAEKLVGDGGFHLAILEKVVTSKNLAADNLGVTKNATANIVYGFPVWHIFLGFLSKVLNTGIFTVYIRVILPVVILVLIVNFALIKIVFKNRFGAFAGFLAFNIYFLSAGAYFLLVPARSPDSLARILLLPLILGLTVYYLYQAKDKKYLQVILIAILAIILGLIHFTQLIDYVLILGVFALLSLIFNRKKEIFIKLGWLGLALFGLIVPYLFIFQFENFRQFFANNALAFRADTFTNKSFHDLGNFYLYTVFTLPLVVLFGQKNKRLVFLLAIPLTLMLVSWETFHLRVIFLKYFGEIFTTRAITDIPTYIFAGFMIFIVAWLLCRLLGASKIGRYAVYGVLILLLGIISFTSLKMPLVNFVDLAVFSPKNPFFYTNFVLILIITTVISSVSYCWLKFTNKDLPDLEITQPNLFAAIILFIIFVLVLPYGQNTTKQLASNQNGGIFEARYWENIGDIQRIGGRKTIDFVSTLRSNNVFITSNVTVAQNVLLYTPSYAAEYPFGISEFTTSVKLYDPNISLDERITILKTGDINYIITLRPYETDLFANETTVFKKVFANDYTYKIQSQNTAYDKQGEFTVFEFLP